MYVVCDLPRPPIPCFTVFLVGEPGVADTFAMVANLTTWPPPSSSSASPLRDGDGRGSAAPAAPAPAPTTSRRRRKKKRATKVGVVFGLKAAVRAALAARQAGVQGFVTKPQMYAPEGMPPPTVPPDVTGSALLQQFERKRVTLTLLRSPMFAGTASGVATSSLACRGDRGEVGVGPSRRGCSVVRVVTVTGTMAGWKEWSVRRPKLSRRLWSGACCNRCSSVVKSRHAVCATFAFLFDVATVNQAYFLTTPNCWWTTATSGGSTRAT